MRTLLASAVFVAAAPVFAQQTVTCSSTNGANQFCRADTSRGVVLLRERSNNVCHQGETWHYSNNGITVSGGCSAVFQVGGGSGQDSVSGRGAGTGNGASVNGYGSGRANQDGYSNSNQERNGDGRDANATNRDTNGNSRDANGNNGGASVGGYSTNGSNGNGNGYGSNGDNGARNGYGNSGNGYGNGNGQSGNESNRNGYGAAGNRNGYSNNGTDQGGYNNGSSRGGYAQNQQGMTIPSGTRMTVQVQQNLDPGRVNQGETVSATLTNDVMVNGRVAIPSGTPVQAKVVSAEGQPLDLRLDSVELNGTRYRLETNSVHGMTESDRGSAGDGSQRQGMVGAIVGAVEGDRAMIPSGTSFTFRLTAAASPASRSGR